MWLLSGASEECTEIQELFSSVKMGRRDVTVLSCTLCLVTLQVYPLSLVTLSTPLG